MKKFLIQLGICLTLVQLFFTLDFIFGRNYMLALPDLLDELDHTTEAENRYYYLNNVYRYIKLLILNNK
jgi:hypothetical protein